MSVQHATIDRTLWPWNAAPVDVEDYDVATWHGVQKHTDGELPIQSLKRWTLEQRVRRSRDVMHVEIEA